MEIRKIVVHGNEFQFVNESRDTRHGFAHDTTLFFNGCERVKHTCHYLNRTWECYRYQTSMIGAVNELINSRENSLTYDFKNHNGYNRLTPKRKEELNKIIESDLWIKELKAVKDCLHYQNMNEVKNVH